MLPSFLSQEPPPGYVAGIGRGATGFTTSAESSLPDAQFSEEGLLVSRDRDDEAERIYQQVEERLRRKPQNTSTPPPNSLSTPFAALKRDLAQVSEAEWANLPDTMDFTRRHKRMVMADRMSQRTYAVPDNVVGDTFKRTNEEGDDEKIQESTNSTDFSAISLSRDTLLGSQLDKLVPNQVRTNPNEYLAQLEASTVGDSGKTRGVLASLRKTQPHRADAWISSARLEESARNWAAAKRIIRDGCTALPRNEEVWLECLRLHQAGEDGLKMCRVLVSDALKYNPASEALWEKAVEMETGVGKRRVVMRALQSAPKSVRLWTMLLDMEDSRKVLERAVDMCPNEWDFWRRLVENSSVEEARKVLNRARKVVGGWRVWVEGAKVEERNKNGKSTLEESVTSSEKTDGYSSPSDKITRLISKAGAIPDWLSLVSTLSDYPLTAQAITSHSLSSLSLPELLSTAKSIDIPIVRQTVFSHAANTITDRSSWTQLFSSVAETGDAVAPYYEQAITQLPTDAVLRMMYAKDEWKKGRPEKAREVLKTALDALPTNEAVWLALVKLELYTRGPEKAYEVSSKVIELPCSARAWYKHIHLARKMREKGPESKGKINHSETQNDSFSSLLSLCDTALSKFPLSHKLYLQKAQILAESGATAQARAVAVEGIQHASEKVDLWLFVVSMDAGIPIKARATLDRAIVQNNDARLWLRKIRLEIDTGNTAVARQLTNKALQAFPGFAPLWVVYLDLIPKASQRRNAFLDALKKTDNSAIVLARVAVDFWREGKKDKARAWFERAVSRDPKNGDNWAWMWAFEEEKREDVENRFAREDVNTGEVWNVVNKSLWSLGRDKKEVLRRVSEQLKM